MVMVAMQDARDRLPELLDRVAGGADVAATVTRYFSSSSAICTALSAAPLRSWSPATNR